MWALIPEVISFSEYTSGKRIAGIVNALTGIFYKAGMALGDVYKRQLKAVPVAQFCLDVLGNLAVIVNYQDIEVAVCCQP